MSEDTDSGSKPTPFGASRGPPCHDTHTRRPSLACTTSGNERQALRFAKHRKDEAKHITIRMCPSTPPIKISERGASHVASIGGRASWNQNKSAILVLGYSRLAAPRTLLIWKSPWTRVANQRAKRLSTKHPCPTPETTTKITKRLDD